MALRWCQGPAQGLATDQWKGLSAIDGAARQQQLSSGENEERKTSNIQHRTLNTQRRDRKEFRKKQFRSVGGTKAMSELV